MQDVICISIYQRSFENKKGGSMRTPTQDLACRLKNLEYAKLYGSEQVKADLALTLSKARHKLNMTQKQFADTLKLSQPYIAKIESGAANPTIGAVGAMLAVLGLSLITHTEPLLTYISSPVDSDSISVIPFPPPANVLSFDKYSAGASGGFISKPEMKTMNA